jgi:hypothetical protein
MLRRARLIHQLAKKAIDKSKNVPLINISYKILLIWRMFRNYTML